ncbi:hypothetical protein LWI29_014577 [Acer saccharum]|uniref:Uncharacterized protein n=1 Tax=Acer saccharum TaxID=4024 RepID=A0AA39SEA1_ACESA|nr:hypothetical protein LWI29_014577 [Acer saccharum]
MWTKQMRKQKWSAIERHRGFRSDAALEAINKAREERTQNVVLYNYPSFSGAFSALFAQLFHSRLHLPCLLLPFSSVAPFKVEYLYIEGLERVYLLDFLGPKGFAAKLSQRSMCQVIGFDHRKSVLAQITQDCPKEVTYYVDLEKSSSSAVYEYFSSKLSDTKSPDGEVAGLLNPEDQDHLKTVLKYIEDADLRRRSLPNTNAFRLLEMSSIDLICKGNSYVFVRQSAASKLLDKVFKIRLGRGFYGECLAVRADGNSNLSNEIGKQLRVKSAAAGLR